MRISSLPPFRLSAVKTAKAIGLFLDSRRAKGLSAATLSNYAIRLGVFARTVPESLPDDPAEIETDELQPSTAHDSRSVEHRPPMC